MQVNASLQNQNLRTDLRWVAKRIRKSTQVNASSQNQNLLTAGLTDIPIDASQRKFANQNLRTDLWWVAKRIR